MKKVIFIMGPTASGKTNLAMKLYDTNPNLYSLVSVDSALIYRGMDIGTAKPSKQELKLYPHDLIDIIDPSESYSAGKFFSDVTNIIDNLHKQSKIPILVGGTMLYYKSLLGDFNQLPSSTEESRLWINQQYKQYTSEELHRRLKDIDISAYNRLHYNDIQRISRVLEVHYLTGRSLSDFTSNNKITTSYDIKQIALDCQDRQWLHERIENRFKLMIEKNFLSEVEGLYLRGDLNLSMSSMRCVGYQQIWQYLDGKISFDEAIFKGICATRQLAKRQITWLRGWNHPIYYIDSKLSIYRQIELLSHYLN